MYESYELKESMATERMAVARNNEKKRKSKKEKKAFEYCSNLVGIDGDRPLENDKVHFIIEPLP